MAYSDWVVTRSTASGSARLAGRLQRQKRTAPEKSVKSGYAKNTVRLIKAALSSVLADAIDDGYLETTNPAYSAGRKRRTVPTAVDVRPLSWEERDTLLTSAAHDLRHHALFSVLAKTGLRPGEGMALKPGDLDFRNLSVRVERAVADGGRVKSTKTYEARTVEMTPDLATTLKRHLTWLKAESLRTGKGEPEWLFPTEEGALMNKDHLAASSAVCSSGPGSLPTVCTISATPTPACCWRTAPHSPT
jgi:integrase